MARSKQSVSVETLRHKYKRTDIPVEGLQEFVHDDEKEIACI
ncbi:MAG: hypothetical protein O7E56_03300 [SAR324 cluster bacterium]|nr:hypothetical protein [SAR324 cluster bacterium]